MDIKDRLDIDHIKAAAAYVATTLTPTGVSRVELTPGDHTVYPLVLVTAVPTWTKDTTRMPRRREILVVLEHGNGRAYPWNPENYIHPDYARQKWGDGNSWTGEVISLFLNEVRRALGWED